MSELLIPVALIILFVCAPITIFAYFFNKRKGKDTSKQVKYMKIQGIAFASFFVISFVLFLNSEDGKIEDSKSDLTITPVPTVHTESEEDYKLSCIEYSYKDVLRNPEEYLGKRVKVTLQISSVHEKTFINETKYYFGNTQNEYGWWSGDRYGIFDCREDTSFKILSDDIIVVYGEIVDPEYTSSIIVTSQEIFCIDMKYMEFISE